MPIRREIYHTHGSHKDCSCVQDSNRITLNARDDFKISYAFRDSRYSPSLIIPLDAFDVEIKYFVVGRPETYQVMKRGSSTINCVADSESGVIKAIFENTGLYPGQLHAEFKFRFPDEDFPDKYGTVIVEEDTGITLI